MAILVFKEYAKAQRETILAEVEAIIEQTSVYNAAVGEYGRLRYEMTNCGKYGWWSIWGYTKINPLKNQRWPRIPPAIASLMVKAGKQFYPEFRLETVLINIYTLDLNRPDKPILGFHQDTSERNKEAPIISLSFGKGTFIVAGKVNDKGQVPASQLKFLNKTLTTRYEVDDGDLLIMEGSERMCFHAAGEVLPNESLSNRRINLTGRMVDPILPEDKPIIISMIGPRYLESLPDEAIAGIERAMSFRKNEAPQHKQVSEILIGDSPGFEQKATAYLKSRRYPRIINYDMGQGKDAPKSQDLRYVGEMPAPLLEILEQADYLLAAKSTEEETKAIAYFQNLGKSAPWIVEIQEIDKDESTDNLPPDETPPSEPLPEPDRPSSTGAFSVTNVSSSGQKDSAKWSDLTKWHEDDWSRVYCGRGGSQGIARSPLHNPYQIGSLNPHSTAREPMTRESAIDNFRRRVLKPTVDMASTADPKYSALLSIAERLADKKNVELVCHCAPQACHCTNIGNAALWLIKEGRVTSKPDSSRLHLGMAGYFDLIGLTPRMELEIRTLIKNKHREWYLKLNGVPTHNPIIHIRSAGGSVSGPQRGFDGLVARYLYQNQYPDVVVHGTMPAPQPPGWTLSTDPFNPQNFDYLFVQKYDEDLEIDSLIAATGDRALIAYHRKFNVNLPDPLPEIDDPQRYAKFAAAVPAGSYVAVIGSRKFKDDVWAEEAIAQFVNALPSDCILVSGAAQGADTIAETLAKARGLKTLIHPARWITTKGTPKYFPPDRLPEYDNERPNAGPERNKVLVDECTCLYAFTTKEGSSGSKDAISYAALNMKCFDPMVFKEGHEKPPAPEEFSRRPFQLFYFDED